MPLMFTIALVASLAMPHPTDGRHDFDFELGTWSMAPSGQTHVVRKLWDGATIAQLILPRTHEVRGSLLSLYDPKRRVWNVYWADAHDGSLSSPMTGTFHNGVGIFTGVESRNPRTILVRIVYDRITGRTFRTVQSESQDGGRSWIPRVTWTYTRLLQSNLK